MFAGINSFTLLALPFFFLAGNVMTVGGISERLVKLAMALVGHLRGGLAHVNVVVGMFLAGISGSSTADAAAIGSIFCPAMKKRGYDERFSVCLTACTATMGAVIPPSILMVIYGATAGVSIGALLIGGIVPGVLMGLSLMVQSHFYALKYGFPREHPKFLGLGAVWDGVKAAGWPLGVPVIIVVGMVGGVFTPTESASFAAVYSLFIALCVFRTLRLRQLQKLFAETTIQFSQVLFCLGGATIFGWLLAFYQVPENVTNFIVGFSRDPIVIMILIVILNVLLGTFMDALPAILIFVPIIHPLATAVGIHPVHLGVIVVMTQSFGLLTPPLGMVAMTACAVGNVPMSKIQKPLHIMMIPLLIVIVLCALAPWTVLALPKLLVPDWL
jgi:tripartite ATP-independent transporter DctM subunit